MSGFASEIAVFVGMTSSDVYSTTFRTVTVFLAAVGLVITPIYLLSMLRQLFYGTNAPLVCEMEGSSQKELQEQPAVCFGTSCVLPADARYADAYPREVFIAACFLLPIIAVGFYPKLATQMYDSTTVAINQQLVQSHAQVAQSHSQNIYAELMKAPALPEVTKVAVRP